MNNTDRNITWNLYLEEIGPDQLRLIMPDETTGSFPKIPSDGYAMKWPVNPHFTGKSGIITMLRELDKFKNSRIF